MFEPRRVRRARGTKLSFPEEASCRVEGGGSAESNAVLFTLLMFLAICLMSLAELVPAALEGKRLHSRFDDGTAVFNNEGIHCEADRHGYTHYHSCDSAAVPGAALSERCRCGAGP